MSDEQFKQLSKYSWVGNQKLFEQLKASKPKTPVQRFRRFYYVRRASWGFTMDGFNPHSLGKTFDILHLKANKDRLKNVIISNQDYAEAITKHDSVTTFFYIDPPYPKQDVLDKRFNFTIAAFDKLVARLQKIKGKFILSCNTKVINRLPKSWHTKRVRLHSFLRPTSIGGKQPIRYELLVANFKMG